MRRLVVALVLVSALSATATGPGLAIAGSPEAPTGPTIVAAYPNPIADGDAGEYVVVSVPTGANPGEHVFTDGETTVSLANVSAGSRVAIANHARAANLTDHSVVVAPSLSLANGGEAIRIQQNGSVVAQRRYRAAPEGELASWEDSRIQWRQIGATDRPVVRSEGGQVRPFVLPDSPGVPVETLRGVDRRILLAGYTLTSERVADALIRARERNLTVRVLLEGDPVGGRTRREARLLDRLHSAGVEVRLVGGEHARYDYHHAKYALADDRAVVMTENWKPSGTGGNSSRGWGVVTDQPRIVAGLEATFEADAGWRDARPWEAFREGRTFERGEVSQGDYPVRFEESAVDVERTELLVTPDNGQRRLIETLDGATDSIDVVQVSVGDWDSPLVQSLRRAARRGVEVRLLLSDAWYVREDNRKVATRFDEWAGARDVPLTVKLAESGDRYGKIHAKGAVIDDERVVLGSLNWNEQAASSNREVIVLLHGESVAAFYGEVFDADWGGGKPKVPVGLVGAVAGSLVVVGLAARRLEFEE